MKGLQEYLDYFHECSFPLNYWVRGTDFLGDILTQVNHFTNTLHQLYQFKEKRLLIPKPTLSSVNTFVFWVHESILDHILRLQGIRGGFPVNESNRKVSNSSNKRTKKYSQQHRRVLLDIGCDEPQLVQKLITQGIEVISLWEYIADLYHYEIIELCTSHSIDLLVSINDRLLIPSEAWIDYLMPNKTRLLIAPDTLTKSPNRLFSLICNSTSSGRKYKRIDHHRKEVERNNR